jgi:hypothetical protein
MTTLGLTAARNVPRYRSKVKGVCWCCNNGLLVGSGVQALPLYPVGTAVGVKMCCAKCCRETFGCRPGFARDGCRMSSFASKCVGGGASPLANVRVSRCD